jgi:hypothetical protein
MSGRFGSPTLPSGGAPVPPVAGIESLSEPLSVVLLAMVEHQESIANLNDQGDTNMFSRTGLFAILVAGLATGAFAGQPLQPGGNGVVVSGVAHTAPGLMGTLRSSFGGAHSPDGGPPLCF